MTPCSPVLAIYNTMWSSLQQCQFKFIIYYFPFSSLHIEYLSCCISALHINTPPFALPKDRHSTHFLLSCSVCSQLFAHPTDSCLTDQLLPGQQLSPDWPPTTQANTPSLVRASLGANNVGEEDELPVDWVPSQYCSSISSIKSILCLILYI